ncbi:hypothetical protein FRB93_001642 [Tulasnella sp. JGI-2019a]|nr:hypothetical protein FRB93_001642 [Tulasnella sp. JGI-2019a]
MIAQPTTYADRAKISRPPSSAKPVTSQTPSTSQTPPEGSQNNPSGLSEPTADKAGASSRSIPNVNGVNGIHPSAVAAPDAAVPGETARTPSAKLDPIPSSTAVINGHSASSPLQPKQNVWVRSEQGTPRGPQSQSSSRNNQITKEPIETTQSQSSSQLPSSSAAPTLPLNPKDNHSRPSPAEAINPSSHPSRPNKKAHNKPTPNSGAPPTQLEPAIPPDFATSADWPAPIEAANPANASASAVPSSSRRDGFGDEDLSVVERAHSRESSSAGTNSHGKKSKSTEIHYCIQFASSLCPNFVQIAQWKPIPPAELQATADALAMTRPSSPRQGGSGGGRGRRSGNGAPAVDDRRNGNGNAVPYGGRSSGHTSKISSSANSPSRSNLSALPSGQAAQGLAVNFQSHALRPNTGHLSMPGQVNGQRSHPHSPLSRSPYILPQSNARQSSPRIGGHSPNHPQYRQINQQPQQQLRHPLPLNPSHPVQPIINPQPKKRVPRPPPSKAQAVSGDILQQPLGDQVPIPTFGSIQPEPDVGLGLSVGDNGSSNGQSVVGFVEIPVETDIVRWHEKERIATEPERILKAEGRYGIGVKTTQLVKSENEGKGGSVPETVPMEAEMPKPVEASSVVLSSQDVDALEPMRSPKHKWSFGSFEGHSAGPSTIRSQIPLYGDGLSMSPPHGDGVGLNGYGRGSGGSPPSGYGNRQYSEDRRGPNSEAGQYGYPLSEAGMGGYGSRGTVGRRLGRGSRGGYGGNRGGPGYPHRGSTSANGSYRGPYAAPPGPPPISAAYPPPMHTSQPPYDPGMAVTYPPPMGPVDYQSMDPYGPPPNMAPPTPGGSQPLLSAIENPYSSHPLQTPYNPYMFAPPTPSGYYAPYPYMPPYAVPPVPVNYAHQPYPPPGAVPAPSMPMPMTSPGYTLDPSRFYLLGQIEYYFSVQNILSDMFLRRQMDSEGWIDINVISSFPRVRQLTMDPSVVRDVMNLSVYIEVSQDGDKCRMAHRQWESFVLPGATPHYPLHQTQSAAQSDSVNNQPSLDSAETQPSDVVHQSGFSLAAIEHGTEHPTSSTA